MEILYWSFQYIWTLAAYIFIMFVWPSVVFKKFLSTKSKTFRFSFCAVIMVAIINTVSIALGLVHLLSTPILCLLFYGTFFFVIIRRHRINVNSLKKFKHLVGGTYGHKSLFLDIRKRIKEWFKRTFRLFLGFMKGHWFEYIALGIVVLFALIYYSYGAFNDYSYGCGDIYTHTMWVYNLNNGVIFSSGIYPEGMHFFINGLITLCGVPLYTAMQFCGSITSFVSFISLYILFREIFRFKYTPLAALAFITVIDVERVDVLYSVCRMQWSLPQEFGYPAMFICTTYLIKFLRDSVLKKKDKTALKVIEDAEIKPPEKKKRFRLKLLFCFREENLLLFTLSMGVTFMIHFYSTFMAFLMCLGVAIALVKEIFSRKLLPLIQAIVMGLVISAGPLAVCFFSGYWLQGSLNWALGLFTDSGSSDSSEETGDEGAGNAEGDGKDNKDGEGNTSDKDGTEEKPKETLNNTDQRDGEYNNVSGGMTLLTSTGEEVQNLAILNVVGIKQVSEFLTMLKNVGYYRLHGAERGARLYGFTIFAILLWLVMAVIQLIYRVVKKDQAKKTISYRGYLIFALLIMCVHLFYCSSAMGLPWLMEPYRIGSLAVYTAIPIILVPVDFLFDLAFRRVKEFVACIIGGAMVVGLYVATKMTDTFRGYLLNQTTRFNSAVMVTKDITSRFPAESYTIVSTTDELYQIMGKSYHEEIIQFINESEVVSYTIPTKYIFLFIEKQPILRNQYHYFTGPSWLAEQKYLHFYAGWGMASEGSLQKGLIREDLANVYFGKFPLAADVYAVMWKRVLLNSKVYVWCQKFNAMYPNELHVYYEDEDFLCYYLEQNPRNLYELATMDPSVMIPPEEAKDPIWPSNFADEMVGDYESQEEKEIVDED